MNTPAIRKAELLTEETLLRLRHGGIAAFPCFGCPQDGGDPLCGQLHRADEEVAVLPWPLHADKLIGNIRAVKMALHVDEVDQAIAVDQDFLDFKTATAVKDA